MPRSRPKSAVRRGRAGKSSRSGARRLRRRTGSTAGGHRWLSVSLKLLLTLAVVATGYVIYLDATIRAQFEGKRWALPAHVFAQPLELYAGTRLEPKVLEDELRSLGYRPMRQPAAPGQFSRRADKFQIITRGFDFWDGQEPSRRVNAVFRKGQLTRLTGDTRGLVRLEPVRIGGIYPAHQEDRVLVRLEDVPPLLTEALVAVEDRGFYAHHGISTRGIARALWANLRAGAVVQGGSTLTQQLVKNYFLTSKRSLGRKAQEAIMALLLELHYSKEEILQAYLNEVHLGQDGPRAIHGFGLASHFYFAQPIEELRPSQLALLVGMVRGASYYNPRRHPERARQQRDRVLDILAAQGYLKPEATTKARKEPLGVTQHPPGDATPYPAFMDLVRRQLQRDYQEEDLTSEGLRIFTTLDRRVQRAAERALARRTKKLEAVRRLPESSLEGAVIVTARESGEVLAIVGGRQAQFAGFNRALDAVRPVGSLIKPAIYLSALASRRYTLASVLQDTPLHVKGPDGKVWSPRNYDRKTHGDVPLHLALAHSYNLATAHLGFSVGIRQVLSTLSRLGVEREIPAYPAVFLGAVNLTPFDVTQMYQTLAAGGFRTPLRAIREVSTAQGEPLARYPLAVEQVVTPADAYLITTALQGVVTSGTASGLTQRLPADLRPAGKTGTTDRLRDSWFAGYTGDYLAVTWLGRDDNQPAGLSGAGGAMQVWADTMASLGPRPLKPVQPPDIEYAWVDEQGRLSGPECEGTVELPFQRGTVPEVRTVCSTKPGASVGNVVDWFRGLFE